MTVSENAYAASAERTPSLRERALALAREKGTVRTKDLEAIGVPRLYPRMMYKEGLLEQVRYGVYRAADQAPQGDGVDGTRPQGHDDDPERQL
jgi:hypothetical protein